jgi:aminopeptidase N
LNKDFYHQTVTSKQVEEYFSNKSGKDLSKIFDQYLRTAQIPVLEYKIENGSVSFRWTNCIDGFNMPVRLEKTDHWLSPTTALKQMKLTDDVKDGLQVDKNFYITVKKL